MTDTFYEATAGAGATRNGETIAVSPQAGIAGARVTGPKPMMDRLARGAAEDGVMPDFVAVERVPSSPCAWCAWPRDPSTWDWVSPNARDWDLAGADLILREAGGSVCDLQGRATTYNRPDPVHGELVAVSRGLRDAVVTAMGRT